MGKQVVVLLCMAAAWVRADVLPMDDAGLSDVSGSAGQAPFSGQPGLVVPKTDEAIEELRVALRAANGSNEKTGKDKQTFERQPGYDVARDGFRDAFANQSPDVGTRSSLGPTSFSPVTLPNVDYSGTRSRVLINR
ncbi:hypothetical protein [Chitinivorax sp. B]|uniref:hypothetical protein n=1 Tax=Chitinivorax sp. B TaxID=2502235 RepID=UPI0010F87FF9|nr:hypothetical protein [Chitinivorax sp. B]